MPTRFRIPTPKDKPTIGELCSAFLFNGTDACTANGFALLRNACTLMNSQIEQVCTSDLQGDQCLAAPKEYGRYDRDAVQSMLHRSGLAFTGQTLPESC